MVFYGILIWDAIAAVNYFILLEKGKGSYTNHLAVGEAEEGFAKKLRSFTNGDTANVKRGFEGGFIKFLFMYDPKSIQCVSSTPA